MFLRVIAVQAVAQWLYRRLSCTAFCAKHRTVRVGVTQLEQELMLL